MSASYGTGTLKRDMMQGLEQQPKFSRMIFSHPSFLLWLVFALTVGTGVGIFNYYPDGLPAGDGADYFRMAAHDWLSPALWFGKRAPLYAAFIKFAGENVHNTFIMQNGLFCIAVLGGVLLLSEELALSKPVKLLFSAALLTLCLQPQIVINLNLLSAEVLHLALVLLVIAIFLQPQRSRLLLCFICMLIWLNREESFLFVLGLFGLAITESIILAWRQKLTPRIACKQFLFPLRANGRRPCWPVIILGVAFLGLSTMTALHLKTMDIDESRVSNVYQMRYLEDPNAVRFFQQRELPLNNTVASLKRISFFNLPQGVFEDNAYKPYYKWLMTQGRATQVGYLLSSPSAFFEVFFPGKNDLTFIDENRRIVVDPYRSDQTLYDAFKPKTLERIPQYQLFYNLNPVFHAVTRLQITPFSVILVGMLMCFISAIHTGDLQKWRMLQLSLAFLAMAWVSYQGDALEVTRHLVVAWFGLSVVTICIFARLLEESLKRLREDQRLRCFSLISSVGWVASRRSQKPCRGR